MGLQYIVWNMLLFDLENDLQMTYNLAYWKDNILNLKRVVIGVNYTLSSWSKRIDKSGLIFGWTGPQVISVVHDVSDHCLHFFDFLDGSGLLWDGGGEVGRVMKMVPIRGLTCDHCTTHLTNRSCRLILKPLVFRVDLLHELRMRGYFYDWFMNGILSKIIFITSKNFTNLGSSSDVSILWGKRPGGIYGLNGGEF